jgi:hypothetical protein
MRIPFATYEALPCLYVICGAAALIGVDGILGRLCGLLLVAAGVIILKMRIQYRKRSMMNQLAHSRYYWAL